MSTSLIVEERLFNHFDHCQNCNALYSTLTEHAEKGLVSLYKKKCYEQLNDSLRQQCPLLVNRRLSELTEEFAEVSRTEGEEQAVKCKQIIAHYFSLKDSK